MTNHNTTTDQLDVVMHAVLKAMSEETDQTSDKFQTLTERLATLYKMKETENNHSQKQRDLDHQASKFSHDVINDARENDLKKEELKQKQQDLDNFNRVSMTTIVAAAVNLVGILAILKHEHTAVITSKALGFVGKLIK